MTYYSHSPSFKHSSPLMRQRSLRTLHDPQSTMDSLIVFYRDEQYWIRRARTAMTLDRDSTMTGSSDSSSSRSDHARSSKHTSQRSLQHLSSPPYSVPANRRRYNDLKTATAISLDGSDVKGTKQRLTKLVREVDKCIALLNE